MRLKKYTLVGFAADADGVALAQAPSATGVSASALAVDQELDIGAVTNSLALTQNPSNAADTDDFAVLQTLTVSVPMTLLGAAASISPSRRASFTSASNLSAINFTIVGTGVNSAGAPITGEAIAGPNATTVNTLNAYSAITSVTPDASSGNTVSIGYPAYLDLGLTLEAGAAILTPSRRVSLTSGAAADFSNVATTVIGLDQNGAAASETISTGPNNNTVTGAAHFSSVTAINFQRTAASVNANIFAGQPTLDIGVPLRLNGTLGNDHGVYSDAFGPSKITLTSLDNLSSLTFTITGLGSSGLPQPAEVMTGPNNTTVTSATVYTKILSIVPSDDNAGSVNAGTAASGFTAFTLEAAAANLSPPRRLDFDSSGDVSAINFTVVGTDRGGRPQTEIVTGVTTTIVRSDDVWGSVTSIRPDGASAQTVTVGWAAETPSPWVVCGFRQGWEVNPTALVSLLPTVGAADGIVEVTFDSPGEAEPKVDETIAVTPGTPVEAQGVMCRVVLTSGAATTGEARIAQPGP